MKPVRALASSCLLCVAACGPAAPAMDTATDAATDAAAEAAAPMTPEATDAVVVATATLTALSDGDTTLLRRLLHPTARLIALGDDPASEPRISDVESFLASVGNPDADFLERMWDPVVHVDGRLATVWTPYDFYRGGAFSHCGIDVFNLVRDGAGDWRVLSITYTVHPEGCAPSPLGPPS